MSTLDFETPLPRNQIAGDYVLGTLSAASRREVERRLPLDDALRADVYGWQEKLLPLAALAEPVEPSVQLWQRIAGSVQGVVAASATSATEKPSSPVQPHRAAKPSALQSGWTKWWESLNLWRGLAGTGFAAAAILAAVLVTRMGAAPGPLTPQYLVVLVAAQDKSPGWVVQASAQDAGRQISLIPLGLDAVLWVRPLPLGPDGHLFPEMDA